MLERGDLLPDIRTDLPGPRARQLSETIRQVEAPGINTLYRDQPNLFLQEAMGSNVVDVDGNRFIDFTSGFGVLALGHRHPHIVDAIRRQSEVLHHALGDAVGHPGRIDLASRLLTLLRRDDAKVYFAISGADAVEIAVKTALLFHKKKRSKILAFHPSYHGLTPGALNLGSRREFKAPFSEHLHPNILHLPYGCPLSEIESVCSEDEPAAVVYEPIVGREGILIPPEGWLRGLTEICRRFGIISIADEIFTGFGRTGSWLATQQEGIVPDLLCCGKGMTGGMPMAAVVGASKYLDTWKTSGEALHTATFVAHPIACAAAEATLNVLEEERLPERAATLGASLQSRFSTWSDRFDSVIEVRGRGLMWGIELVSSSTGGRFGRLAWKRGILLLVGGPEGKVAQLIPPLNISERQLDFALDEIESILDHLEPVTQSP